MSEDAHDFIGHLRKLNEQDRAAMAILRRSLAFAPGAYPPAYPYVECFVSPDWHAQDGRRLALYAVAGLFAQHPQHKETQRLASALGNSMRKRESASIEQRFVALLGADADNIVIYLRHIIGILIADEFGLDYTHLLNDLRRWMKPHNNLEILRQNWARDFYRTLSAAATDTSN